MRWMFVDGADKAEAKARSQALKLVDAWWQAFAARKHDLESLFARRTEWDLPGWMHEHLHRIDKRLMWEYGPAVKAKGHRLVITPESDHHLHPLVRVILKRAPALAGWEFYAHRLPESVEDALVTVEGRVNVRAEGSTFDVRRGEHGRIDLHFTVPQASTDEAAKGAAFVLTETLLGEDILDEWIGEVSGTRPARRMFGLLKASPTAASCLSLDRLQPTVTALKSSMREQLPKQLLLDAVNDDTNGAVMRAEPDRTQEDYPEQEDVVIASTVLPEILMAAKVDPLFSSSRFSRCDETFCYMKVDASNIDGEQRLDFRRSLEDSLDATLKPARLGCVVGGAMGLRYVYVELALTELTRSIPATKSAIGSAVNRHPAWLQFHDARLKGEWVNLGDHNHHPPGITS